MAGIPHGYCHCGCGEKAPIIKNTWRKVGRFAGQPFKYILGHNGYVVARKPEYEVDKATGCWNWVRSVNRNGYGYAKLKGGKGIMAHRMIYIRHRGPIPDDLPLDHLCRNPRCVNPDHLEAVPMAINVQRGDVATLLPDQVLWMREKRSEGWSYKQLAAEFGVDYNTALAAVLGTTWSNL